jgi:cysteinyl-tRNA synthetase
MDLTLYNTLTRTKERFTPIDAKNVRMYVCGPTVYDFAHIGNARPVIVFDVLFRLLRHLYGPEHVTYVRNITDVDDKINARALRDHPDLPLNDAIRKVTETTANQFFADAKALGCLEPTVQPRATDNIEQMIELIQRLIAKGHAYEAGGEVLFSLPSMPDYGQLSQRKLDEQLSGARVAVDAHKENPADFVLWKVSDKNEPGWHSPWGRGRPGWHIECSAMSHRYLGEVFDIHGGGLDLIFPHHENEIAQSRCSFDSAAMANVWMHNGFLQVEGQKMSKSVGNFVTISELMRGQNFGNRNWSGEALRLTMLRTHYRQPIDWTVTSLTESDSMLRTWENDISISGANLLEVDSQLDMDLIGPLLDDLNFSESLKNIHVLAKSARNKNTVDGQKLNAVLHHLGFRLAHSLGITSVTDLFSMIMPPEQSLKIGNFIAARLEARKNKNWAESDRIRDELAAMGIAIKDNKDGTTSWEVKR